jgi:hypothetical protein
MPNVPVFDIKISRVTGRVIAFTYGRGAFALGGPTLFVDDPLVAAVTIKAIHVRELRARINTQRLRYGLAAVVWTDPDLVGVTIRAVHVVEMRTAIQQAYSAANRAPPTFTDLLTPRQGAVKAVHISELRAAVVALE